MSILENLFLMWVQLQTLWESILNIDTQFHEHWAYFRGTYWMPFQIYNAEEPLQPPHKIPVGIA